MCATAVGVNGPAEMVADTTTSPPRLRTRRLRYSLGCGLLSAASTVRSCSLSTTTPCGPWMSCAAICVPSAIAIAVSVDPWDGPAGGAPSCRRREGAIGKEDGATDGDEEHEQPEAAAAHDPALVREAHASYVRPPGSPARAGGTG